MDKRENNGVNALWQSTRGDFVNSQYKGYKHRYCKACRYKRTQNAKHILKDIDAGSATVSNVAVVTGGKINPKNKREVV